MTLNNLQMMLPVSKEWITGVILTKRKVRRKEEERVTRTPMIKAAMDRTMKTVKLKTVTRMGRRRRVTR